MPGTTFRYTARTADGAAIRGSMQAPSAAHVVEILRGRSLSITRVTREAEIIDRCRTALGLAGGSAAARLAFFRSFVTLIRAGVSMQRALLVTIERTADPTLAEALRSILADVEQGLALSDGMSRHPTLFKPLHVAMVRAGESGGILDDVLERLTALLERDGALTRKLRTALTYPAIVAAAAGTLVVFLLVTIVPMFAQLFANFAVPLPGPTRFLLALGAALATPLPWLLGGGAFAAGAIALDRYARTGGGALAIDRIRLRLPVVGALRELALTARVMRMLATLLRSGIELTHAIETIIPVTGSAVYAQGFGQLNAALHAGEALAPSLARIDLFDPMIVALVRAGEETGLLDEMLLTLAEHYERDVEAAIGTLGAVIEPAVVIVLGGVVGFIVFSIFLPLYTLTGSLTGQ